MFKKLRNFLLNLNLRTRLMLFFILTASLPVLLASFFSLTYFNNINTSNAKNNLRDKLHSANLLFEKKKNDIEKITRLASTDNLIIVNLELLLYPPISNHLKKIIKTNNLSFLSILDENGKIIVSGNKNYFIQPEKPILQKNILSLTKSNGNLTFNYKLASKEFNIIERKKSTNDEITMISSISPIKTHNNKILGYIFCGYIPGDNNIKNNFSLLKEIKNNVESSALIFDQNSIISYSDGDIKNYKFDIPENFYLKINNNSKYIFQNININDRKYLFCISNIRVFESNSPIFLGIGILENKYLKIRNQAAILLSIFTIFSLIIAVIIAFFLSEGISRPILSIVEGTKLIVKGKFKKKIHIKSQDEIGMLANSFNIMTDKLSRRINMDNLVSKLSRKFINLPRSEANKAILDALEQISNLVGADRSYVFLFNENHKYISNTHEWHKPNLEPNKTFLQNVNIKNYPWFIDRILNLEAIYIPDINKLPKEASIEQKRWQSENIHTLICVPMFYGKSLKGFTGFDFFNKNNSASKDDIQLLSIIGEIICNTLERIKFEQNLTNTKNSLKSVFNAQSSILISTNNKAEVTEWNTAAEKYTKIPSKKAINKKVWDNISFLENYKSNIEQSIKTAKSQNLRREVFSDLKTKKKKYFNISFLPINKKKNSGIVISIDDITELVKKDNQLLQAQKMETVGNLAGGLAHDFNNVIGAITGTVSYMKYSLNNEAFDFNDTLTNIQLIEKSADRAKEMVKQLLTLSRKHDLTFSPVDLNLVVQNVVKIGKHLFDKSIEIKTEYSDKKSYVHADINQIEQVLLNLCINASHAMTIMRNENEFHGGTLTISVDHIYSDKKFSHLNKEAQPGKYIVLKVSDTGIGIDVNNISKIFDPFYTTKVNDNGTGLGLAMVYNIIKQHNGFIDVYSEKNVGSSFNIFLPELEDNNQTEVIENNNPIIYPGTGTILIIDDEETIRHISKKILKQCGYDILIAENGQTGIKIFKEHYKNINLVLLDMAMPKIPGDKVYQKIKLISPNSKVLLSSGFKQDKRVQKTLNLGANGFIQKPYSMYELSKKVYDLITNQ